MSESRNIVIVKRTLELFGREITKNKWITQLGTPCLLSGQSIVQKEHHSLKSKGELLIT
ncbi:MAG TPA: hypothetical protein VJ951_07470 [Bacteroidales bacterium]|nr:hypothetical protein [Bacteroidales bacterium]